MAGRTSQAGVFTDQPGMSKAFLPAHFPPQDFAPKTLI